MAGDAEKGKYFAPSGSKTWEYLAVFWCSFFGLCIGSVVGWNSPSVVKLMSLESPIPVTASHVSTLVAMVAVGHMVAPPINTVVVDRIGRRNTILLSALPLIVSWALITIASSVWELYLARFLAGISLGLCICVSPMYVGEISSADTRGAVGAVLAIMYNLGILMAFIVTPWLSVATMAATCLALSVVSVAGFWFMPESPYFLAMRGRTEEAEEVLCKLRGKLDTSEELRAITDSLSDEPAKREAAQHLDSLKKIFLVRGNLRAFVVIALFTATHHLGGFFTVLTYGQLMLSTTGSVVSDHTANVVIGVVQVASSVITTFLVDRLGRKPLILASGLIVGLCNLVIGAFFSVKHHTQYDLSAVNLVPFAACLVLVFAFNCGFMSLQIIMMSEVFATEVKALSTCLIGIIGGLLATVSSKLYIYVAITWNYGHGPPFFAFAMIMWLATGLILYLTPETKGKTFQEIQREFHK